MGDAVSGPAGLSDPDAVAAETARDAGGEGGGADRVSHRLSGELECIWNVDSARGQQGCVLPAPVCTRVRRGAGGIIRSTLLPRAWRGALVCAGRFVVSRGLAGCADDVHGNLGAAHAAVPEICRFDAGMARRTPGHRSLDAAALVPGGV